MKQIKFNLFFIVLALSIIPMLINAQAPQLINYQGNLLDGDTPVTGTVNITFTIFDAATAGNNLWTETQTSVSVVNGVFQVLLGSVAAFPANLFSNDGGRFLEVNVGGTALSPRQQITSVAYALTAQMAEEVKPGEVVTSINNLEDDITLTAGANVTISEAGNTITISATGGTGSGDITAVAAGDGMTGGGDNGDVALNVGQGPGMNITETSVELDTTFTDERYVNTDEPNSVNADMIYDETGLAHETTPGSAIDLISAEHSDLVTVTISAPEGGYIFLSGRAMVELGGTTETNGIRMQIDTAAAGTDQTNLFSYILLTNFASVGTHYYDCSAQRTYIVDAPGEYTFRLEARKFGENGTARIYWPFLTAQYFSTAYGNVAVTSSNSPTRISSPNSIKPTE